MLKVTLVKSTIGNTPTNRRTVQALGLGKIGSKAYHNDTPSIRGMIHAVKHLLAVEENVTAPEKKAKPVKAAAPKAEKAAPKAAAAKPKGEPAAKKPAAKKATKKEEAN
jgi:large subunit ribosomal protein L30